jgi:hypothetical protein
MRNNRTGEGEEEEGEQEESYSVLLSFTNAGFIEFTLNMVLSLDRLNFTHYIIIALDTEAADQLEKHNVSCALFHSNSVCGSTSPTLILFMSHSFLLYPR